MSHGKTETRWRSVIEDIKRVAIDFYRLGEGSYRRGQRVERVRIFSLLRYLCESKAWQVWRDYSIAIRETGNQLEIHEGRGGKTMQQKTHRCLGISCLSVKNLNSIGFDLADRC